MSLKELLGEELYNQVMEKAGDNKLAVVSDGNWFPKDKFDAVNNENKKMKQQISDRDEQLEALKEIDPEKLKQEIADLQASNEQKDKDHEAELKDLQLKGAIKLAVKGIVHDEEIAVTLIDKEQLVIGDDGEIVGLDKQIEGLKESKAYLFKSEENQEQGGNPSFTVGNHKRGSGALTKGQIMKVPDNIKRQQLIRKNSHLFQ